MVSGVDLGNAVAGWLTSMGDPTNRSLHTSIWLFHGLVAFGALAAFVGQHDLADFGCAGGRKEHRGRR